MNLLIVRHGQTLDNLVNVCQGQNQGTLSLKGIMQAGALAAKLKERRIDKCYASDLRRASHTAEILYPDTAVLDTRLRERDFGSLQGKDLSEVLDLEIYPNDVETIEQIWERVDSFFQDLKKTEAPESTILLVSHGITIKTIIAYLTGKGIGDIAQMQVPDNCSVTELSL